VTHEKVMAARVMFGSDSDRAEMAKFCE